MSDLRPIGVTIYGVPLYADMSKTQDMIKDHRFNMVKRRIEDKFKYKPQTKEEAWLEFNGTPYPGSTRPWWQIWKIW